VIVRVFVWFPGCFYAVARVVSRMLLCDSLLRKSTYCLPSALEVNRALFEFSKAQCMIKVTQMNLFQLTASWQRHVKI